MNFCILVTVGNERLVTKWFKEKTGYESKSSPDYLHYPPIPNPCDCGSELKVVVGSHYPMAGYKLIDMDKFKETIKQ